MSMYAARRRLLELQQRQRKMRHNSSNAEGCSISSGNRLADRYMQSRLLNQQPARTIAFDWKQEARIFRLCAFGFLRPEVMKAIHLVANNTEFKDLISVDVSETPVSNPLLDKLEDLPVLLALLCTLHGKSQEDGTPSIDGVSQILRRNPTVFV